MRSKHRAREKQNERSRFKRRKSRLQLLESWTFIKLHVKNVAFPLLDRRHQSMQILEMQLNIEIRNGINHFFKLKLLILKLDIILYKFYKNSFYYFSKI